MIKFVNEGCRSFFPYIKETNEALLGRIVQHRSKGINKVFYVYVDEELMNEKPISLRSAKALLKKELRLYYKGHAERYEALYKSV